MWNEEPELYRGKYYARSGSGGSTKRRSLRTTQLDVAKQRLKDLTLEASVEPSTVADIFMIYREEKEDRRETLKYIWRCLGPFFGHLRPDQITRSLCVKYKEKRQVSDGTIIRELNALRAALRRYDSNTPAQFSFPEAPPPKHRYLTKPEFQALLEAVVTPHIRTFIVLALCTAARKTALLELTWDRVDLARGQIDLGVGEVNKGRAILPLNNTAIAILKDAYLDRLTDYVIEYRGKPLKDIKSGFATAVKTAGLIDVSPHVLRHTAAVWMAEDGVPMSEIAQYLGHSSTKITERVYARYSPAYLKKAANSLELGSIEPTSGHLRSTPSPAKPLKRLARVTRLELAASAVTENRRSVQKGISLSKVFNRHPFRVI